MKKKASLLFSILLLLAACHSEKKGTDNTDSLKIGYIPSTDILPYIVAQQKGIYDSLKLNLKLIPMESEINRDTLFSQKRTDGSILSPIEAFMQQEQGIPAVPTFTNEGLYYIVASNDSTFTKPEQLREKSLSVTRKSAYNYFADKVLDELEITQDDINKPELSREPLRMQMLENGQIDAAVLRDPYVSKALQKGCKVLLSSSSCPITLSVTAFSDSILNTKENDIKKLIIGYNLAVQYMNKHHKNEWFDKAASAAGLNGLSQELSAFKKASELSTTETQEIIQWMQEYDILPISFSEYQVNRAIVNDIEQTK